MTTPIRICSRCGCTSENLIEFHDRLLCPDCLDSMTEICADCGTRFWHRDNCNTAASPLCPDCYDRNYTRCTRCGSLISLDECWYPYECFLLGKHTVERVCSGLSPLRRDRLWC